MSKTTFYINKIQHVLVLATTTIISGSSLVTS